MFLVRWLIHRFSVQKARLILVVLLATIFCAIFVTAIFASDTSLGVVHSIGNALLGWAGAKVCYQLAELLIKQASKEKPKRFTWKIDEGG